MRIFHVWARTSLSFFILPMMKSQEFLHSFRSLFLCRYLDFNQIICLSLRYFVILDNCLFFYPIRAPSFDLLSFYYSHIFLYFFIFSRITNIINWKWFPNLAISIFKCSRRKAFLCLIQYILNTRNQLSLGSLLFNQEN